MIVTAAVAWLVVMSTPALALPIDDGGGGGGGGTNPPPTACSLSSVTGNLSASPTSVAVGQGTTLSWGVNPGNCSASTLHLLITGLGSYPNGQLHGSGWVMPVGDANGNASYSLYVFKGTANRWLRTITVPVVPPTPVYGRSIVHIDWNVQVEDFIRAVQKPNTTVLLADDLNMNLTGRPTLHIARGVHIIGGRSSTKPGPRLFTTATTTDGPTPMFAIGEYHDADGVRISGVRIDGGDMGIPGSGIWQDSDPTQPIGIRVDSSVNVEIGNSEIYGWSGIGIQVLDGRNRIGISPAHLRGVWIHDNYIHHNRRYRHEGYGVQTGEGAYALIERNVLNLNRHALESTGSGNTGYLAYNNLLGTGGGENSLVTWTHQFDVHGTQDCGGMDAYCGQAGQYYDYRYNTLFYVNGDVIKLRGEPTIGADVTENVFSKGEGSSAISQTEGVNLHAWSNRFNVIESYQAGACDFDGNGQNDDFMATGATWWYRSVATGHQFYYLHTSTKMTNQVSLGDANGDGRCDVTVDGSTLISRPVPGAGETVRLTAPAKRTDLVLAHPYTGPTTGGSARLSKLDPQLGAIAADTTVNLVDFQPSFGGDAPMLSGTLVGTGDFNGDGTADLLWRTGDFVWITRLDADDHVVVAGPRARETTGPTVTSERKGVTPPGATLGGIGDFNADGRSDILWRRPDGQLILWMAGESGNSAFVNYNNEMFVDENGIGHPAEAPVITEWKVRGVADFNGDGYADILWRHDAGMVVVWYMVHGVHVGEAGNWGTDPTHFWEIQGIGDFNGDGRAEILWRGNDGTLVIWNEYLYEVGRPRFGNTPGWVATPDWQIAGLGDFNGDGRTDILWRQTTGTLQIWKMNGIIHVGPSALLPVDATWQVHGLVSQARERMQLQ